MAETEQEKSTGLTSEQDKKPERSEERYQELVNKLKEQEGKHALEMSEASKRIAELEFENRFKDQVAIYPSAKDFRDKIKEQVSRGLSVEEATILVLGQNKKLQTAEEIRKTEYGGSALGGSVHTPPDISGNKKPLDQWTKEEKEAELRRLEEAGEIRLT